MLLNRLKAFPKNLKTTAHNKKEKYCQSAVFLFFCSLKLIKNYFLYNYTTCIMYLLFVKLI